VTLGELAELLGAARILSGDPGRPVERAALGSSLRDAAPAGVAVVESGGEGEPGRAVLLADAGLDAAAGERAGLVGARPLVRFRLDWRKLVGFVPENDVERVADAVFAAGAGRIGEYERCSFRVAGTGTFRPLEGADPAIGERGVEEHVAEVRIEAVYPAWREVDVVDAYVAAHPYEEPAFDLLALENMSANRGRGRLGTRDGETVAVWLGEDPLASARAAALGVRRLEVAGEDVRRAGELAAERLTALAGIPVDPPVTSPAPGPTAERVLVHVDGGARGNPGPAAIGYVLEAPSGEVLEEAGEPIGVTTNNVAEYRALLAGLAAAERAGAREVDVRADSELLVRQMTGAYKVRNETLRRLWSEAQDAVGRFARVEFEAVPRARNAGADRLVNEALDRAAGR
jgi:ribonuclease HI